MKKSMKMLAMLFCAVMILCIGISVSVSAMNQDSQGNEIFYIDIDELFPDAKIGDEITDFSAVKSTGVTMHTAYFSNGKLKADVVKAEIVSDGKGGKAVKFTFVADKGASRLFEADYKFVEGNKYKIFMRGCYTTTSTASKKPYFRSAAIFDAYNSDKSKDVYVYYNDKTSSAGAFSASATSVAELTSETTEKTSTFTIKDMVRKSDSADLGRVVTKKFRLAETMNTFLANDTVTIDYIKVVEYAAADINFAIDDGATVTTRGSEVLDGETIKAVFGYETSFAITATKEYEVKVNGEYVVPVDGVVNLGVVETETRVEIITAPDPDPVIKKTAIKFVDYGDERAVYVYGLLNRFSSTESYNYGINLWETDSSDDKMEFLVRENDGTPSVAASGDAFAVKVYGDAISNKKGYTAQAFVGETTGDEVTVEPDPEYPNQNDNEYHILSFGNSYSSNSHTYLAKIAAADGVVVKAVNMYSGGAALSLQYNRMKGSGTYEKMYEYLASGTVTTEDPTFDAGLFAEGYRWDYITLHQKGRSSPFFDTYYTESKPYLTELADYIKANAPGSEVLMFCNWAPYSDRIVEKYEEYDYKSFLEGKEQSEYYESVFKEIKSTYFKAAEKIGNPGRVIPVGEAVYLAIKKYGFTDAQMYADSDSHMTNRGKILAGLVWYEYLTGNDARENKYTNTGVVNETEMALLKEIAHEACSQPEYIKK